MEGRALAQSQLSLEITPQQTEKRREWKPPRSACCNRTVSLLQEIQNGAIRTDDSVAVLLRQCLVLAARLRNDELRDWAKLELNGYPNDLALPQYRPKIQTQVLGNFSGPFGSGAENMGLSRGVVPEEFRDDLFSTEVRQGVAEIESLLGSGENEFQISWPMNVVAALQDKFMTNMNLMGARQVLPATALEGTLSGIRDRIVEFALEIEKLNPNAGEATQGEEPIEQSRVVQVFNQTFHGDNTAFAAGQTVNQTQSLSVKIDAVMEAAEAFGISDTDRASLREAIDQDGGIAGTETRRWIERLNTGAISVGTSVTAQTATAALLGVLGLS